MGVNMTRDLASISSSRQIVTSASGSAVEATGTAGSCRIAAKKVCFLAQLRQRGTVYSACRAAGIGRQTAYRWRARDARFAAVRDAASEDIADLLEESLFERARAGDVRAAMFLLRALRPEKCRQQANPVASPAPTAPILFTIPMQDGVSPILEAPVIEGEARQVDR